MGNLTKHARRSQLIQVALALTMLGTFSAPVQAQVFVTDVANIAAVEEGSKSQLAQQLLSYTRQGLQYANDLARYTTLLQQLNNMLTSIEDLGTGISLVPQTLQPLSSEDTNWLVQQHCAAPDSGILGNVLSGVMSMMQSMHDQPVADQQHAICVAIILITVDKYNITAKALGELKTQAGTVEKLQGMVDRINTLGKAESTNAQAQSFLVNLNTAKTVWENQIKADDAMISALQQQQSVLGQIALKGTTPPLGTIVQAAAFATAFQ